LILADFLLLFRCLVRAVGTHQTESMGDHMDQGMNGAAMVAAVLAVLGASGVAAAGVRTEGMYVSVTSTLNFGDEWQSDHTLARGLVSSVGSVSVHRDTPGLGSSLAGYRFDVADADQPTGRIRFDGSVEAADPKATGSVGSHGGMSWFFRTSEPVVLELRGIYEWRGDVLSQNELDIGIFGESGMSFRLMTSSGLQLIDSRVELPAGHWGFHITTGLYGGLPEQGRSFATRSSLDLDFRIVPAPATLAAFVGLGVMASRRRR
jgi:hypothetical protein